MHVVFLIPNGWPTAIRTQLFHVFCTFPTPHATAHRLCTHMREMVSGIFHALFGAAAKTSVRSFFDFKDVRDIDGSVHDFGQHRGKVIVVSNTASY